MLVVMAHDGTSLHVYNGVIEYCPTGTIVGEEISRADIQTLQESLDKTKSEDEVLIHWLSVALSGRTNDINIRPQTLSAVAQLVRASA